MFNSTILDVAIGMIFIYLLLSLLSSAANELIELLLKKRALDLERGLRELLKSDSASGDKDIVRNLYNHPLINGLFAGRYEDSGVASALRYVKGTRLPSYIPARNFALALMDLVITGKVARTGSVEPGKTAAGSSASGEATQLAAFRAKIGTIGIPQVEEALKALTDVAGDNSARARANIEDWFNSSMDRVSGWYKRRVHMILLVLGFVVAVVPTPS